MLCVQRCIVAGPAPAGRVRFWQVYIVQCQELKTGQKKFQLYRYYENGPLCPSRYIIYLWVSGTYVVAKQAFNVLVYRGTLRKM